MCCSRIIDANNFPALCHADGLHDNFAHFYWESFATRNGQSLHVTSGRSLVVKWKAAAIGESSTLEPTLIVVLSYR